MAKPRISDATGWEMALGFGNFTYTQIFAPTGLAPGVDPRAEKRFSYVPEAVALRNWFRVVAPGRRDKYFYGELAHMDAHRYALDCELNVREEYLREFIK